MSRSSRVRRGRRVKHLDELPQLRRIHPKEHLIEQHGLGLVARGLEHEVRPVLAQQPGGLVDDVSLLGSGPNIDGGVTVRSCGCESDMFDCVYGYWLSLVTCQKPLQDKAKDLAVRSLRALAGFAKSLKLSYKDIEVGLDFDPEPGLADNGDLEHDLQALLVAAGRAAKAAGTRVGHLHRRAAVRR